MSERHDAIARYLAVDEACQEGRNIFAKLNTVRCEFAIRNRQGSYIGVRDDGTNHHVPIKWERLKAAGLMRSVPAA